MPDGPPLITSQRLDVETGQPGPARHWDGPLADVHPMAVAASVARSKLSAFEQNLDHQLAALGRSRVKAAKRDLAKSGHHPHVDLALVLAIASRETGMRNIAGDGGHGRGFVQVDDRYHAHLLATVRGCRSGSWRPVFGSALASGRVPTMKTGVTVLVGLIEAGVQAAAQAGVPFGKRVHFACAAFNAGAGGARQGWLLHGDPDAFATGRDYGSDVQRRRAVIARLLHQKGWS